MIKWILIALAAALIMYGPKWLKQRAAAAEKARQEAEAAERRAKAEAERQEREARLAEERARREAETQAKAAARAEQQLRNGEAFEAMVASIPRAEIVPAATDITPDPDPDFYSFKLRNVTAATNLERLSDFIAVDVETTGLDPAAAEIVQLAAVKFRAFEPVEAFVTYVRPEKGILEKARKINGITEEMVADAPPIGDLIAPFRAFAGEKLPIVGHNLLFDLKFLVAAGCLSLTPARPFYDTLELGRKAYDSESYTLDYLCTWALEIRRPDAHDALSDAVAAGKVFRAICEIRKQGK